MEGKSSVQEINTSFHMLAIAARMVYLKFNTFKEVSKVMLHALSIYIDMSSQQVRLIH